MIQNPDSKVDVKTMIKPGILLEADQFWHEINVLSDKFQPSGNFAREEAYFELKKSTMNDRRIALDNTLRKLEIL